LLGRSHLHGSGWLRHPAYDQAHRITIGEKVEGHRYGEKRQGDKGFKFTYIT